MTLAIRRDQHHIEFLTGSWNGAYDLYINDFLIANEGRLANDLEILEELKAYAEKHGWRGTVQDIMDDSKPARMQLANFTPTYMHPAIDNFMSEMAEHCDPDVVYTQNSLIGDFMVYAKFNNLLQPSEPTPSERRRADIEREREFRQRVNPSSMDPTSPNCTFEIMMQKYQIDEIKERLTRTIGQDKIEYVPAKLDEFGDPIAQTLLDMFNNLHPVPGINLFIM